MQPRDIDPNGLRINIGGAKCTQPYSCSLLNVSAMSFGALSANAIESLNKGAKLGDFAHDTGEGGLSRYHRKHGGDIIWEIGSGYFGCRKPDGTFDPVQFAERANDPQVKMLELKMSQGAKPGHGGMLPGAKVTEEIAEARGVPVGTDCISPATHSAFSSPLEMMKFLQKMRELGKGKPVGFKFCVGHRHEFMGIVKAMLELDDYPDFIVIDGKEGGTGAAPLEFANSIGLPLREGLHFVNMVLIGAGIRDKIKLGASGKIISGADMARVFALGADWCNSARGFMFSLGCIQSRSCHTNRCPTGVATQDKNRQKGLDVDDKSKRVRNFHHNTLHGFAEMLGAMGLECQNDITIDMIHARERGMSAEQMPRLRPGQLFEEDCPSLFAGPWAHAQVKSFRRQVDDFPGH